jgi:hypothetical protein
LIKGSRIDWTNLAQGAVYRVHCKPLGQVLAELVDKEKLRFRITEGRLQSQANRKKVWKVGDEFEAVTTECDFFEVK